MSEADVELVRRWYELSPPNIATSFTDERFIAAARPMLEQLLAPDFVYVASEEDFTGVAGEYHGVDGLLAFMGEWFSVWESYYSSLEELIDLGDGRVLALGHEVARSRTSSVEMKNEFGIVYHVTDGRIHRMDAFLSWEKARRAAGLEE